MTTIIQNWLESERPPSDVYELLARPRFDPDRDRLLAAIRSAFAELHPYENHNDPKISAKATRLLKELGRAEGVLTDPEKLREHHELIVRNLQTDYAKAEAGVGQGRRPDALRAWLKQQHVHPDRLEAVARAIEGTEDETLDFEYADTQEHLPAANEPAEDGFFLQEERPAEELSAGEKGVQSKEDDRRKNAENRPERVPMAKLVPAEPRSKPKRSGREPGDDALIGRSRRTPPGRRRHRAKSRAKRRGRSGESTGTARRRPTLLIGLAIAAWILVVAVVWSTFGGVDSWRGELLEVRGHDGEIHLVLGLASPSPGEASTVLDAFTDNYEFHQQIVDYVSADESPRGDHVIVNGKRRSADRARFTLADPSRSVLVELHSVQKVDEPASRAVVGQKRSPSTFDSDWKRSTLARIIRVHPGLGESTGFQARYRGLEAGGILVAPTQSDQRQVKVEFAGSLEDRFASYAVDDEVYIVATPSDECTPGQLVLRGTSIRRLNEPGTPGTQ